MATRRKHAKSSFPSDRQVVEENGEIASIVELQVSVVPRGRSTANITMVTADGKLHPFSLNLDDSQQEAVKSMVKDWMRYKPSM